MRTRNLERLSLFQIKALSVTNVQILSNGLKQSLVVKELSMCYCELGDEHLHELSLALGNHPTLSELDFSCNNFGDDGISSFVNHWQQESRINSLNLCSNKIGCLGAQCLINAIATTQSACMRHLYLSRNEAIGYDGLKLIGEDLPRIKLVNLHLNGVAEWTFFSNDQCEAALEQKTKRKEACDALLEGIRNNYHLEFLEVDYNMRFISSEVGGRALSRV